MADTRVIQISQETEVRTAVALEAMRNTVLPILLIPLSWLFFGLILNRQLRPLANLTQSLLTPYVDQSFKLDTQAVPWEVLPLVEAMNDLLSRQQELLELRQRFISDAAHQLRSPVTALKLQMLNFKQALGIKAEMDQFRQLEGGLGRMALLLEQLLRLARAEAPLPNFTEKHSEIDDVVRMAIIESYPLAQSHHVELGLESDVSEKVVGDHFDLVMLIGNLIENAILYGKPEVHPGIGNDSHIDVAVVMKQTHVLVTISDHGPGLPQAVITRVFERFSRHSVKDTIGSGLGLSIVAALAHRCGATVTLTNRQDGQSGLVASVQLQRFSL